MKFPEPTMRRPAQVPRGRELRYGEDPDVWHCSDIPYQAR